jgi:hypothetical protein
MLSRVDSRISKFDTMFEGDVASYFLKGLSGYRRQRQLLNTVGNCRSTRFSIFLVDADVSDAFWRRGFQKPHQSGGQGS